jgi:hypothetical protein
MDELGKLRKKNRQLEYGRRVQAAAAELGIEFKNKKYLMVETNTPSEKMQALQEISSQIFKEIYND